MGKKYRIEIDADTLAMIESLLDTEKHRLEQAAASFNPHSRVLLEHYVNPAIEQVGRAKKLEN